METETSKRILSLTDDILEELKRKHPHAATIQEDSLLHGPIDYISPNIFDSIDEDIVYKAALNTKGAAGPSGMDAELYRRILC